MFTQTQLDEKAKAEFERGLAEGNASAITAAAATATAEFERGKAEGSVAGATAERERIKAVEAQALAGHGDLISTLKFDGKTTGEQAAVAVLSAERKVRGDKAKDLSADAGIGVVAGVPDAAKEAAAVAAAAQTDIDPNIQAAKITAHIAAAAKEGRKLSVSQASAELRAQK